jgi:hypothetical protein
LDIRSFIVVSLTWLILAFRCSVVCLLVCDGAVMMVPENLIAFVDEVK